ncbi:MAG: pyridoxamine 5'-phosphate oxidase family protein [Acidobacteriota bacterium]
MIDRELAAFLEEGLAIHMGTRDADLEPNGTRATAIKSDEDGRHVTVYVPKVAEARVLPNLEANGQGAVVLVRVRDERSCQLKGVFVEARAAAERERTFVMDQWDRFVLNIEQIGLPRAVTEQWKMWPCLAIRLQVTELFDQTPGPRAGSRLT